MESKQQNGGVRRIEARHQEDDEKMVDIKDFA